MKKALLTSLAMVLVGVLYYFTVGSRQITEEIKDGINSQIVTSKE